MSCKEKGSSDGEIPASAMAMSGSVWLSSSFKSVIGKEPEVNHKTADVELSVWEQDGEYSGCVTSVNGESVRIPYQLNKYAVSRGDIPKLRLHKLYAQLLVLKLLNEQQTPVQVVEGVWEDENGGDQ